MTGKWPGESTASQVFSKIKDEEGRHYADPNLGRYLLRVLERVEIVPRSGVYRRSVNKKVLKPKPNRWHERPAEEDCGLLDLDPGPGSLFGNLNTPSVTTDPEGIAERPYSYSPRDFMRGHSTHDRTRLPL